MAGYAERLGQDLRILRSPTNAGARKRQTAAPIHVAVDRLASFRDSKADKRHLEFVAQESERVQYDTLFAVGA